MESERRVSVNNKKVTQELREYIDKLTMDLMRGPKGLDARIEEDDDSLLG